MAGVLTQKYFHDEEAAFAELESIVWPKGPHCPHCGATDRLNKLAIQRTKPSKIHPEGKPVYGLWKCYHCRKQFTVRVGTVFEASHVPLHLWLQAAFLMCSSKKGISSHQLARTLGVTVKSAWFMSHRLREAMNPGYHRAEKMGGGGQIVEADETIVAPDPEKNTRVRKRVEQQERPREHHMTVFSLVERGGEVRSFHIEKTNAHTVLGIMADQVERNTSIHTDEGTHYKRTRRIFTAHTFVTHSRGEYVRGAAHTNTIENYFSIFKRGVFGTYQHISQKHLRRYLAEFDFRYNNRTGLGVDDQTRTFTALKGIVGKRLTYRWPDRDAPATA